MTCDDIRVLIFKTYIYIYIYMARERERERVSVIGTFKILTNLIIKSEQS